MRTIVKRSASRVSGEIRGMKACSYQPRPFTPTRRNRVAIPAAKGIPR
jgi:hypothetical protein